MSKSLLWLDNDRAYLKPYVDSLSDADYEVTVVETASLAEAKLHSQQFSAVIIDVMIPTKSAVDEETYRPSDTENGYRTGLIFWQRNCDLLKERNTPLLVLTVRLDDSIRREFAKLGLPDKCFATKYEMSDPDALARRIDNLVADAHLVRRT